LIEKGNRCWGLDCGRYSAKEVGLVLTHMLTRPTFYAVNSWICRFVLLGLMAVGLARPLGKKEQTPAAGQTSLASGKETFLKFCASCHGVDAKGNGPAAFAMRIPPADLTTLARRYNGEYPVGYVGALLMFGRNSSAHGAEDMPVWGSRFKDLDPAHDPLGQHHVDDVVAYIASLQQK
jgi:mono/diheme cytochrome c family protein